MTHSFPLKEQEKRKFRMWGLNASQIRSFVSYFPGESQYEFTYPVGFFRRVKVSGIYKDNMNWENFVEDMARKLREQYLRSRGKT